MPDLDLEGIVTAVFDVLAADAGTKSINWEKGRFTPYNLRSFPAGGVSLGPGTELGWATIPSGFGGTVAIRIMLWTSKHEGLAEAEAAIQDLLGKVYAALFKDVNRTLNVASYSTKPWILNAVTQEVQSNIEFTPPHAEAAVIVSYQVRK
jgi:hypothetical protein